MDAAILFVYLLIGWLLYSLLLCRSLMPSMVNSKKANNNFI